MAEKQEEKIGRTIEVVCDGLDEENGVYLCRSAGDAPEIDALVYVESPAVPIAEGEFLTVTVTDSDVFDLYAERTDR